MNRKQRLALVGGAVVGAVITAAVPIAPLFFQVSQTYSFVPPDGLNISRTVIAISPQVLSVTAAVLVTVITVVALRSRKPSAPDAKPGM